MTEYFTKDGDNYVKVEETLHTQSDLDQVVKGRAERIVRSEYGDYDQLKEKAGKVDTITQEFTNKLTEKDTALENLNKELGKTKLEVDKVKIVTEFKLSDDLAEFVTGDSADEMRQRAEKLAKGITPGKVTVTKDGKPDPDSTKSEAAKVAKSLFGRNTD